MLTISLTILSLRALLSTQTRTITVTNPTKHSFEYLSTQYSDNLLCPCTNVAIPHSVFISISASFHPICSSQFVSYSWYNQLAAFAASILEYPIRIENVFGSNYFQIIATFCTVTNQTVADAYRLFRANEFVSSRVISQRVLEMETNVLIDTFLRSTRVNFVRSFQLARTTAQINQLASRTLSNFRFYYGSNNSIALGDRLMRYFNPNISLLATCSCGTEGRKCGQYSYLQNSSSSHTLTYFTSFIARCLPTESTFTSTLECWFNQTCNNQIMTAYIDQGVSPSIDIGILDENLTRFSRRLALESIIQELMVENWNVSVSYDQFFQRCAPSSCVYTIQQRFDWFHVLTSVVGYYGGLSQGLHIVLPLFVGLAFIIIGWTRQRQNSKEQSTQRTESQFLKRRYQSNTVFFSSSI